MTLHLLPVPPFAPRIESTCRPKPSLAHLSMQDEQILIYHRRGYSIEGICIELGHDRRVVLAALRREVL